jgi:hypothetical protein
VQFVSRHLGRWPIALACVIALTAAVLLPGLGTFGLWEPQERQLADRVAPRIDLAEKDKARAKVTPPPPAAKDSCQRIPPPEPVARSLTNRAMVFGRDRIADSDAGRRLPLALLGLLTVLAAAGVVMRLAGPRAGLASALILVSMPLLVFQSRQLTSEIGIAAGAALTLYGFVSIGASRRRSWLLGLDTLVALASLVAGLVIGFLAGGALLGLLVPLGAFAVAYGLGVTALRDATRAMGAGAVAVAGLVHPRVRVGRDLTRVEHLFAWSVLGIGLALVTCGALLAFLVKAVDSGMAYALLATGAPLAVYGGITLARAGLFATVDHVKALVATLATAGIAALLTYEVFSLIEPQPWVVPPQRAAFGKAIVPSGCYSPLLGAVWRPDDDLRYSFDSTFEQIAYGTFPWGVIGPIAIAALLGSPDAGRRRLGALSLAWAAGAWLAAEVFQRKVGFTLYGGFPALAMAIGAWLDDVLSARGATAEPDVPRSTSTLRERLRDRLQRRYPVDLLPAPQTALVGLFMLLAAINLGKDLISFPERLSSLLVGGDQIPYPKASHAFTAPTKYSVFSLGASLASAFALAWIVWRDDPRRVVMRMVARRATLVTLGMTAVLAAFWSFGWLPALANNLSSKAMFDTYHALRDQGDQLVIMGDMGDAPAAYAPESKPETMNSREQLVAAIGRPNRVFAIAPQTELCQLHREIGGRPYFVVDDRNTRSLLLSNRVDGTTDKNPLRTAILHSEPKQITKRPKAPIVFDNKIELLGWDMPARVSRGDKFTVRMYYKIRQAVGGNWRVLFHFDGALRFNGDHEPIKGRCQTSTWQPGDFIVDTHTVTAGAGAFTPGPYEVWTGFFTGSAPNWKNMTVSEAPADQRDTADRVKITTIMLD